MIVLDLQCDRGHRFEGWFASAESFRDQSDRHLVCCPQCQSSTVAQLPSAPHVRRGANDALPAAPSAAPAGAGAMDEVRRSLAAIARKAENVGERFPEEARRIHYEEAPARSIRGVATLDETRELLEEGIAVLPAPVPPDDKIH